MTSSTTCSTIIEAPAADPQAETDPRGIALDRVGISGVSYPILISGWESSPDRSEVKDALFTLSVSLAAEKRGIHMSRLLETLHHWEDPLSPTSIPCFLTSIRKEQPAQSASFTCAFTWFVSRPAPQTERPAWQGIETTWHGHQYEETTTVGYTLRIPITTLCPCSRAISDYGAHSQRGWVRVKIEWPASAEIVSPQEIFEKLQHAGSAPIYPLLKRADERHVTMLAYEQPAFVEDTARRATQLLSEDPRILGFQLDILNEESIHTHDAVASLSYTRT
jgi:GTP cyclohydrolase FolE2